ncbi:tail fiber protein [Magnetospirillum sp. 64-120]|uniref:phage tail protein n=1 Tax=Magnetospirillum sp. 64-120 TaxID=1895778 RepID=UPI0025C304F0|nr:tail fiber protein [Magnetospirillum sp. 64-120]
MSWMTFRMTLPAAIVATVTGLTMTTAAKPALACSNESFMGTVCTFAFNYCPQGFLPANGQMLSINENPALYSLLGTTYGGDGRSTFALPDFRGRSPVGQGSAPGLSQVQLGQQRGQENITLKPAKTFSKDEGVGDFAAVQTVPTVPPQLGVTVCIVSQGLYPVRPY